MLCSKARGIILVCIFLSCLFTDILCSTTNISARQELPRSSNIFIRLSLELTLSLYESLPMWHETSSKLLKQFTESVVEEILTVCGHPNVDFRAFVTQKCSILNTVAKDNCLEGRESQVFTESISLFVDEAVSLLEKFSSRMSSPLESNPEVLSIIKLGVKAYRLGLIYTGSASSLYFRHTILILLKSVPNHFRIRRMDTILRFYLLDATAPTLDPMFNQPCVDFRVALSKYLNYLDCFLSVLKELLDASHKINSIPVFFDYMKEVENRQFSKNTILLRNLCPLRDTVIVELQELMKNPLWTIDQPPIESFLSRAFNNYLHLIILSSFRYYTPAFVENYKKLIPSDRTSTLSDPGHFKPTNVKDSNFLEVVAVLMIFKEKLNLFRNSDEFMKLSRKNDPLVKSVFSFVDLLEAYDFILKSGLLKDGMLIGEESFTELKCLPRKIEDPSIMINRLFSPTIEEIVCAILTSNLNFLSDYVIHEKKKTPSSLLSTKFHSKATYFRTVFCTTILETLTDARFFYHYLNYFGDELVIKGFMNDCTSTDLVKSCYRTNNEIIGQLVARYYEDQGKYIEEISKFVKEIGEIFGDLCDYYANVAAFSVILPMVSLQIFSQLGSERSMQRTTKILKDSAAIKAVSMKKITGLFNIVTKSQALAAIKKAHSFVHEHYLMSVANLQYLVNFVGWHKKYHSYFPKVFKESIDIKILPQITKASSKYSPDVICRNSSIWKEYISDLSDIVKGRSDLNIQIFYEYISSDKNSSLLIQEGIVFAKERLLNKRLNDEHKRNLAVTKPHLVDITGLLDMKEDEGESEDILEESLIDYSKRTMDVLALLGTD